MAASPDWREQIRQVEAGNSAPVYLVAGGDPYIEEALVQALAGHHLPPGEKKMIFSLDDDRPEAFIGQLGSLSLFGGHQLIVVRQIQRLSGKLRDELTAYVKKPDSGTTLVLMMEEYKATLALFKAVQSAGGLVDARPPFPSQLRRFATAHARSLGHEILPEALDLLMDMAGDSMGHLASELDKTSLFVSEKEPISFQVLSQIVAAGRTYPMWMFQEAVADGDKERSLKMLSALLNQGINGTQIVGALAALFTQLFYLQSRTSANGIYTGLGKLLTSKLEAMSRRYPPRETAGVLRKLLAVDLRMKSTSVRSDNLLIPLVINICP